MFTFENFFLNTQVVFKKCKTPKREPNFVSKSGSSYWYGTDKKGSYVIRKSDHWSKGFSRGIYKYSYLQRFDQKIKYLCTEQKGCGKIASCYWSLFYPKNEEPETKLEVSGKAYLTFFKKMGEY